MDTVKNAAYSVVATAPSPATSGLSLVVSTGEGARFPTTPFYLTIWPTGSAPPLWASGGNTGGNFEIVRVASRSSNTLTIAAGGRAQLGTTARTVVVGDQVAQTVDEGLLDQIKYNAMGFGAAQNIPFMTATSFGTWDTANRAYFWRFFNGKKAGASIRYNVVVSAGNLSFQICRNNGLEGTAALPGVSLFGSGSFACPAAGPHTVALGGIDIAPGDWVGMTSSTSTASFTRMFNGIDTSDMYLGFGGYKESAHPLPNTDNPTLDGWGLPGACMIEII